MKIRFSVPQNFLMSGRLKDLQRKRIEFKDKGNSVSAVFVWHEEAFPSGTGKDRTYLRQVMALEFEVSDEEAASNVLLKTASDNTKLCTYIIHIANRVLMALRDYGSAPGLRKVYLSRSGAETTLRIWKVKIAKDNTNFERVLKPSEFVLEDVIRVFGESEVIPSIGIDRWTLINEAVEDDLITPPDIKLTINAIELLSQKNIEHALLEIINCLEVVLTEYLRIYLKNVEYIPDKQAIEMVNKATLYVRINWLIPLILDQQSLKEFDQSKVKQAIAWRNKIVHEQGSLPKGISDKAFGDHLLEVVKLIQVIAKQRDRLAKAPELHKVALYAHRKYPHLPKPSIKSNGRHNIAVTFRFVLESDVPGGKELVPICQTLVERLSLIDKRFEEKEHLMIRFTSLTKDKPITTWIRGALIDSRGNTNADMTVKKAK